MALSNLRSHIASLLQHRVYRGSDKDPPVFKTMGIDPPLDERSVKEFVDML